MLYGHKRPGSRRRGRQFNGYVADWNSKRAVEPWREYPDWRERWAALRKQFKLEIANEIP